MDHIRCVNLYLHVAKIMLGHLPIMLVTFAYTGHVHVPLQSFKVTYAIYMTNPGKQKSYILSHSSWVHDEYQKWYNLYLNHIETTIHSNKGLTYTVACEPNSAPRETGLKMTVAKSNSK